MVTTVLPNHPIWMMLPAAAARLDQIQSPESLAGDGSASRATRRARKVRSGAITEKDTHELLGLLLAADL